MTDRTLSRRRAIRTLGVVSLAGLAGCSSGGDDEQSTGTTTAEPSASATAASTPTTTSNESVDLAGPRNGDDLPKDTNPEDGYPPEFDTVPEKQSVNPAEFETLNRSGTEIRLVPTDVAYYWWARGEARFADARSESEFDVSHVFGSVLSPAADGVDLPDDPAVQWPKGDRIITYCDCPHHLSSLRAASLKSRGFEEVYALDEGFGTWRERNFPMAGSDVGRVPPTRVINGSVPIRYGGETAWAYHTDSNQREATTIADDGTYELELKFVDLTAQSKVRIETPAYELTAPVGELTSGRVTADGTLATASGTATGTTTTDDGTDSNT